MSKDIRQFLHYYLGCEIAWDDGIWEITSMSLHSVSMRCVSSKRARHFHGQSLPEGSKIILRKLESMTEDEVLRIAKNCFYHNEMRYPDSDYKVSREGNVYVVNLNNDWFEKELRIGLSSGNMWYTKPTIEGRIHHAFDSFHYLLSCGFDLFGLIDAGLAIDKQT